MNIFKIFYTKYLDINLLDFEHIGFNLEINKVILFLAIALCLAFVGLHRYNINVSHLLRRLIKLDAIGKENAKSLRELKLSESRAVRRLVTNREGYLKRCIFFVGESRKEEATEEQEISSATGEEAATVGEEATVVNEVANATEEGCENAATPDTVSRETAKSQGDESREEAQGGVPFLADGLISPDAKIYIPNDKRDLVGRLLEKSNYSVPRLALSCGLVVGIALALIFAMPEILPALNDLLAP